MSGNCPCCDGDGYKDIVDDFGGVIGPRPCEECDGTGDRGGDLSRRVNELVEGIADAVDRLSTVILYGERPAAGVPEDE